MTRFLSAIGICLTILAVAMNWSIVNTAIPVIQNELNASLTMMQWLMNAFGLAMVPFLVSFARIGDLFGRRLVFVIAALVFALASLFAALSSSLFLIIIFRAVQGLASAALLPMSQVLMTKQFDEKHKGLAIGIWMLTIGIGCGFGPLIGGLLIQFLSWRWIFYINVPLSALGFLLCLFFTKESKDPEHTPSIDPLGNFLLIVLLASLILAVVQAPDWGWLSPLVLSLFAVFVVFSILFYLVEKRLENPIIDFSLYKTNRFFTSSVVVFYIIFFVWSTFFLMPLYLQNVLNFEPLEAGLALLFISIPFALLSPYIGHLQKRVRSKYLLIIGLFCLFISSLIAVFLSLDTNWTLIISCFVLFGLGWAFAFGPSITAALDSFPDEKVGLAAGSINTCQEFGGSIGLAILGSLFRSQDKSYVMKGLDKIDVDFVKEHLVLINSKMNDPKSMLETLKNLYPEKYSEMMTVFYDGFLNGFHSAMLTLTIIGICVFLVIAIFMKKKEQSV